MVVITAFMPIILPSPPRYRVAKETSEEEVLKEFEEDERKFEEFLTELNRKKYR